MNVCHFNLGFLCCTSLGGYGALMCDWPSNFNFNYIGSLRCMAQIICYEVKITIILLSLI